MRNEIASAEKKMVTAIDALKHQFTTLRTGRASAALLDGVIVSSYGTEMPLKQVCSLTVPESNLIVAQPWDPKMCGEIDKAIRKADLGLNPVSDGKLVRIPIPQPTEERRKELVKLVRRFAEEGKVAVRNVRRDVMRHLEELVRNGDVGDDEERRAEAQVQKLTDEHTARIDELLKHKEAEIMEV